MARILIVEDECVAAWSIRNSLEHFNYEIIASVFSGKDAIQVAKTTQPDLVLMDIYLRGEMDGITAAQHIRLDSDIPVIFLTADADHQTLQRAIKTEPFGYLIKPFNQFELYTTIETALHRHRLEKELAITQQWLSATLTSIGDGAIATDLYGNITFMNPTAEELTGWRQSEAIGQSIHRILDLIDPDTRKQVENPCLQAIQTGIKATRTAPCILRSNDGTERWIGDSAAPIQTANGDIMGSILVFQDVTDRRETETLLHRREQEFRALVEHSPDIIARFDSALRYVYINPAMEQMTGIPAHAFHGKTNRELGMPQSLFITWETALQTVLNQNQEQIIEFDLLTVDGVRSFQARLVPELAPDQTVESVLSVARDITTNKRIQDSLRQQAEFETLMRGITHRIRQSLNLNDILNTTVHEVRQHLQTDRVIIYRFEPDWSGFVIVESVGSQWIPMLGRNIFDPCLIVDECIIPYTQGYVGNTADIHQAGFADCYVELLSQFQIKANLVIPILQGDQLWGLIAAQQCATTRHWHDWEIVLIQTLADQLAIAIQQSELYQQVQQLNANLETQVTDRTAQLQQASNFEATLKRVTDRLRDSLDEDQILQTVVRELAIAIGVKICNVAIYTLPDQVAIVCYEYSTADNTAGSEFQGYPVQMAKFSEGYHQLLQSQYFQFCGHLSGSQSEWVAKLACPIVDDQGVLGDLWLVNHADYCFSDQEIRLVLLVANQCAIALRQARLYRAAQTQVKELERLNTLKDDFLSTVSHELRTPMANIRVAIQMLEIMLQQLGILDESADPPNRLLRYIQILKDEGAREINLIDDLLDLSRVDRGRELLNPTEIDPSTWLPQLVEPFIERTRQLQQSLILDLPDIQLRFRADLTCLERILNELLTNACKYTPAGEYIRVSVRQNRRIIELIVSNTGVEILEQERDRIFEKFYRIPNQDPWKHSGTGLGLALVHRLTQRLGGCIQVTSGDGQTTFTVSLPLLR
ncbi:MAG: GAF domain-containing protein [Elainellaceae cyanobacterium]